MPVGSLGQLMVALLTLEQAELGVLPLDVPVTLGPGALAKDDVTEASRIALEGDRTYMLGELVKAILVAAPENAAVAVGEAISGTVSNCVETMNARASLLGMNDTRFIDLSAKRGGTTTARDLARLGQALTRHENVRRWASVGGIPFDETESVLRNRNRLIGVLPGADGLATSDNEASHSIIATAVRGGFRLLAVVAGAPTSEARYEAAFKMLDWGFSAFEKVEVVKEGEHLNVSVNVENGSTSHINPVAGETLALIRARGETGKLVIRYQVASVVEAPLKRTQPIGEIVVEEDDRIVGVVAAVAPADVAAVGLLAAARQ